MNQGLNEISLGILNNQLFSSKVLKWSNLGVKSRLKSKKIILDNVSGWARSGEVLAIMGSSGAGKSTLMNVLAKRNLKRVKIDGQIAFNGSEYKGRLYHLKT